jgi:hypothetical protein
MARKNAMIAALDARVEQARADVVSAQQRLNFAQETRTSVEGLVRKRGKKTASKPAPSLATVAHHD